MKIVFINRYFYPDESATSQILTDLAFELANKKDNIWVVCSRLMYDGSTQLPANETINGVHIKRIWTTSFGRSNLIGRSFDYLSFYISALFVLLFLVSKNDVVVSKTDPPLISLVASFVCKVKGAKLVNWIQDLFPEVASALGMKSLSIFENVLIYLRNISLKTAKMNVVIGETMKERLLAQGVSNNNIIIVDNWSDGSAIKPVVRANNSLRKDWQLSNEFVVGYSGNMGRAHEFDTILGAVEELNDSANIKFIFIGGGAKKSWLEEQVKSRHLNNVIFKPYQERSQLMHSLCVPDIHLISLYPTLEGLIVPSKFYGIAAAGRPVIFLGSKDGEIARKLTDSNCGISLELSNVKGLVSYLIELSQNYDAVDYMGKHSRELFMKNYDKPIAIDRWENLLTKI